MLDIEAASSPRWMASLVAQPYGSTLNAQVALPYGNEEVSQARPVGVSMGSLGLPSETVVLTALQDPDGSPDADETIATGSIGSTDLETENVVPRYPVAVQETKGDLMMSRAGFGERYKVDPDAGGMVRIPRYVIDPPKASDKPMIHSFLKSDPSKNGKPVMVASLDPTAGLKHVIAFQPLLTSPLEEVWRGRIEIDDFERDRHCLATAVYFEARGESEAGQRAVAQVVLNRVLDYRYPSTVCGVVFQNQTWRNRCQFSFACDGRPERISDKGSWSTAVKVAEEALVGDYFDEEVGEATHYHATYVRPRWSRYLRKVDRVGTHIFYQLRPGQR